MKNKTILLLLVGWRSVLFLLGIVAHYVVPYKPSFPYAETLLLSRPLPQWLVSWANFDGVHYLTIIEKGYIGTGLIQAFFPLFPISIKILSLLPIDPVIIGLCISNAAFIAVSFLFYKYLAAKDLQLAKWSLFAFLLFPTSFFLGAFYTESLFLLLIIASLWSAEKKKWLYAALFAGLASATRIVGIFLIPALLLELLQQHSNPKKHLFKQLTDISLYIKTLTNHFKEIVLIGLGSLGLIAYMVYLQLNFNDPFYFFHVQSEFGGGRQESLVLLPQVIWRYVKIFITYRPFDLKYFAFVQEFVLTALAYLGLIFAAKNVRWSWTLFGLLAITLPTLTGTFSSMPRYVLAALPIFVLFGEMLSKKNNIWKIILGISALLLVCNTLLFIQGYWVA
jgi:hypothetical protein